MAAIINDRDITITGSVTRTVGVQLPPKVDLPPDGTLDGQNIGDLVDDATAGADHASSTGNPHGVSLSQISGDLDDIDNGSTYFKTTENEKEGGGLANTALDSTADYRRKIVSTKMTLVGSFPGSGVVMDANGIRMYRSGNVKVNLPATTGDAFFDGDIDSNGSANFNGLTSASGVNYAGVFNDIEGTPSGVQAYAGSGGIALRGQASNKGTNSMGVLGINTSGAGVVGSASTGIGVIARSTGTGDALSIEGDMAITSTQLVSNLYAAQARELKGTTSGSFRYQQGPVTGGGTPTFNNNKPGSSASNSWIQVSLAGNTYYIPVWP